MKSFSNFPSSKALSKSSCPLNTIAGASIICFSSGTAEILMTDLPKLPFRSLRPPDSLKGLSAFLTIDSSTLSDASSVQTNLSSLISGCFAYSPSPPLETVATSGYMHPASINSLIINAGPPEA